MKADRFTCSDGGRHESGLSERKDCSVRAHAIAYRMPYADAHALYKRAGRKDRDGTPQEVSREVRGAPTHDYRMKPTLRRPTYAQWIRDFPIGRFVVHVRGHAFAVIDGVQHDNGAGLHKPRARVVQAWRIT